MDSYEIFPRDQYVDPGESHMASMASRTYPASPSHPTERTFQARRTSSAADGGVRKRRRLDTPFPYFMPPKSRRKSLNTSTKYDGEYEEDGTSFANRTDASSASPALPIRTSFSLSRSSSYSSSPSLSPTFDPVYRLEQSLPNLHITAPPPSPAQDSSMAYHWPQSPMAYPPASEEEKLYIRLRIPSGMKERMKRTD